MLVLLPPSEGKASPVDGPPVALPNLVHSDLNPTRERVGNTLARVSSQRNALAALGVPKGLADQVARNRTLWDNPAAPASTVYAGVLYDAAQIAHWDALTLAFAQTHLRIVSALWGAISPSCAIPAYRLSMDTSLGRLGGLAKVWRPGLDNALRQRDDAVVIDCRSAPYAAAWRPRADRCVTVRVVSDDRGHRTVVSHMAKRTRGVFVGRVMRAHVELASPAHVLSAAWDLMGDDVMDATLSRENTGHVLTLVVPA